MKNKKNPKADIRKKSLLFFQIGLIIVLFTSWAAINWKTYEKEKLDIATVHLSAFDDMEVPITKLKTTPPPPLPEPKVAPPIIKVADDDADIVEDIIKSTETSPEDIPEVKDIKVVDPVEPVDDIPFRFIEDAPIFPGCEGLSNDARKTCMSKKIQEFVKDEFDQGLGAELGLTGLNKIYVQFKIKRDGNIEVIGARGPHPKLEQEARRVINELPVMEPGKQRGKPVGVLYSLPIVFKVQD